MTWTDNVWKEMNRMQRQMDRLFGNLLSTEGKSEMIDELSTSYRKAFTNFKETDNEFIVQVEVPGVDKGDIKLNITDTGLEIRAEKKQENEKEGRYSRSYAGFYQAFDVPDNADLENVDASYKNGVLIIKIPKKITDKKKKTIQIK